MHKQHPGNAISAPILIFVANTKPNQPTLEAPKAENAPISHHTSALICVFPSHNSAFTPSTSSYAVSQAIIESVARFPTRQWWGSVRSTSAAPTNGTAGSALGISKNEDGGGKEGTGREALPLAAGSKGRGSAAHVSFE